jgi:hypothetical protein
MGIDMSDEPNMPADDDSAEAFGAALAGRAAVELEEEGLTPAELKEIGRRAGEAIRDAARSRWELGMPEEETRTWFRAAVQSFVENLRRSGKRPVAQAIR